MIASKNSLAIIKSPLNYIGGKGKILEQILPLFPRQMNNFVDLFAGGGNVGLNVWANKIYLNDNLIYLIEMYRTFQNKSIDDTILHIEQRITEFRLSLENEQGYKTIRQLYNQQKNPLDLFVLIAFSFNHQIRFNNQHEFNNPFGRARSSFNVAMKNKLLKFLTRIKELDLHFSAICFRDYDFSRLGFNDLVYCDPPYLISTGTYNDGKRGFKGWTEKQEKQLLELLDQLHSQNIKFALSNVLEHKGKSNHILQSWLKANRYNVNLIECHYANSNYQTMVRDANATKEVLITNYLPIKKTKINTLF